MHGYFCCFKTFLWTENRDIPKISDRPIHRNSARYPEILKFSSRSRSPIPESSILNFVLNDLEIKSGSVKSNMKVSLAPQEPWIFEGTVRENILLGKTFNESRYKAVLDASCLDADIKLLGKVVLVGSFWISTIRLRCKFR